MSDAPKPHTYGEIADVIQEYFVDLDRRVSAIKDFALAIVMENALQANEIDLLKAELADKYNFLPGDEPE